MNPEQFCYWLQGMMEAPLMGNVTADHYKITCSLIYNKLKEVNQQQSSKENKNECI